MLQFLHEPRNHSIMEEELTARGVKCMNFYDVLIDFILLDAFEEVEKPPPPVRAIIQNRWISASFRETVSARILIFLSVYRFQCVIISITFKGDRNGTLVCSHE